MIHMGIDHRCVMATFVINAQKRMADLKRNEDKRTAGTTEVETEKEKEILSVARTAKAEAEMDTRETAPHDQEADANTAAVKEKPVTVRCNAHSQRSNNEETMSNCNRNQNKTPKIRR